MGTNTKVISLNWISTRTTYSQGYYLHQIQLGFTMHEVMNKQKLWVGLTENVNSTIGFLVQGRTGD
jgi:hypothetical protein